MGGGLIGHQRSPAIRAALRASTAWFVHVTRHATWRARMNIRRLSGAFEKGVRGVESAGSLGRNRCEHRERY